MVPMCLCLGGQTISLRNDLPAVWYIFNPLMRVKAGRNLGLSTVTPIRITATLLLRPFCCRMGKLERLGWMAAITWRIPKCILPRRRDGQDLARISALGATAVNAVR